EEHGPGAVAEALRRLNCAESCDRLITAGLSGALVPQLGRRDGVQLLRALCEKSLKPGPGCPAHKRVAEALMSADGMKALVAQLAVKELGPWAAFALGHLCIRNPLAQVRAGRCQAIRSTVRLLSRAKDFQQLDALEAGTYALWNLLVGQPLARGDAQWEIE
ncbi:unnamed protein product, partial [Effrenium voratum]